MRELESAENFKTRCHETKRRVYGGESLLCQGLFFFFFFCPHSLCSVRACVASRVNGSSCGGVVLQALRNKLTLGN